MSDPHPEVVFMTANMASRLGIPRIPYKDGKVVATYEGMSIAVAGVQGDKIIWHYWVVDPKVLAI